MKLRLFLFVCLLVVSIQLNAQDKTYVQIDSLIANANYTDALNKISISIAKAQPSDKIILKNKQAEVLILLGKLDDADVLGVSVV